MKTQTLLIGGGIFVAFLMWRNAQAAAASAVPALPAPDPSASDPGATATSTDPGTYGNSGAAFMGQQQGNSRRFARKHPQQWQNLGQRPHVYARRHPHRAERYGDPYGGGYGGGGGSGGGGGVRGGGGGGVLRGGG